MKILDNPRYWKLVETLIFSSLLLTPLMASAAPRSLSELLEIFAKPILMITPIVISASLLVFFWGMAKFIYSTGNKIDLELAKKLMIWGVIALFVMTSVWGIIRIFTDTLGDESPVSWPFLPTSGGSGRDTHYNDGFY